MRVHAVGLNFRDVLNVLGEYPGDPPSRWRLRWRGCSDGDASRFCCVWFRLWLPRVARAWLRSPPRSAAAHTSFSRRAPPIAEYDARGFRGRTLHGTPCCARAAAGALVLRRPECIAWLGAITHGTAGRPHKHGRRRWRRRGRIVHLAVERVAVGLAHRVRSEQLHVVLNSLSSDFTSASFALLAEGCFEEIERGVWSLQLATAAAASVYYDLLAVDVDMVAQSKWMQGVLRLWLAGLGVTWFACHS